MVPKNPKSARVFFRVWSLEDFFGGVLEDFWSLTPNSKMKKTLFWSAFFFGFLDLLHPPNLQKPWNLRFACLRFLEFRRGFLEIPAYFAGKMIRNT